MSTVQRIFMVLMLCLLLPVTQAKETELVLLLDNSSHMKENDPHFLLRSALPVFLAQLKPDTRLAVFLFDKKASLLLPWTPAASAHKTILRSLQRITYRDPQANVAIALEKALAILKKNARSGAKKIIALLNHDTLDTHRNKTKQQLHALADQCEKEKVMLFGIGFADFPEDHLLQSLTWHTHGQYFRILEMQDTFRDLSKTLAPMTKQPNALNLPTPVQPPPPPQPEIHPPTPAQTDPILSVNNTTPIQAVPNTRTESAPHTSVVSMVEWLCGFCVLLGLLWHARKYTSFDMHGYLHKMRGSFNGSPPRVNTSEIVWSWIGGFIGIGTVALLSECCFQGTDSTLIIGSLGSSAVLTYGAIRSPLAQPRNVLGGHIVSAIIGVACYQLLPTMPALAGACAVSTAIAVMHLTRTLHPPGGATALIAVIGSESIHQMGWLYALLPATLGPLILIVIAVLVNNISDKRRYPEVWF